MAIFVTLNKGTAFVPNGKLYSSLIQRCSFVSVQNVIYFVWDCFEMSNWCSYCTNFTFQINSCDCYAGRLQEKLSICCLFDNLLFAFSDLTITISIGLFVLFVAMAIFVYKPRRNRPSRTFQSNDQPVLVWKCYQQSGCFGFKKVKVERIETSWEVCVVHRTRNNALSIHGALI